MMAAKQKAISLVHMTLVLFDQSPVLPFVSLSFRFVTKPKAKAKENSIHLLLEGNIFLIVRSLDSKDS